MAAGPTEVDVERSAGFTATGASRPRQTPRKALSRGPTLRRLPRAARAPSVRPRRRRTVAHRRAPQGAHGGSCERTKSASPALHRLRSRACWRGRFARAGVSAQASVRVSPPSLLIQSGSAVRSGSKSGSSMAFFRNALSSAIARTMRAFAAAKSPSWHA